MFQMRAHCAPDCFGATLLRSGLKIALGCIAQQKQMPSERNPSLRVRRRHHGAESAVGIGARATFTAASRPVSLLVVASRPSALSQHSQVASLRAWLRSSSVVYRSYVAQGCTSLAVERRVAVQSSNTGPHPGSQFQG